MRSAWTELIGVGLLSIVGSVLAGGLIAGCGSGNHSGDGNVDGTDEDSSAGSTDDETDDFSTPFNPIPMTCEEVGGKSLSNVGCQFIAIDLPNHHLEVYGEEAFSVAVANVQEDETATVFVYERVQDTWELVGEPVLVEPRTAEIVGFPDFEPYTHGDFTSGIVKEGVYKFESDVPIALYQFNPFSNRSMTSDASMLIPMEMWGSDYMVAGWQSRAPSETYQDPAQVAIIAREDGTEVTVKPTFKPHLAAPNVPDTQETFSVTINAGEALYVNAEYRLGEVLEERIVGTQVTTQDLEHPIAVFSAAECTNIPLGFCCCDHIEEQLPPTPTLGIEIVASRLPAAGVHEGRTAPAFWQIVATKDQTSLEFKVPSGVKGRFVDGTEFDWSEQTLSAGEPLELMVDGQNEAGSNPGDFHVKSNHPISVVQYMVSAQYPGGGGLMGDPAMVYVAPSEQFFAKYVVYVPPTWDSDYLVITKRQGTWILVNGEGLKPASFSPVGDSGWEVGRILVKDGLQVVESVNPADPMAAPDDPFGVIVMGFDGQDSYAYTGGMGLTTLIF